jgi:hypothetical protein
MGFDVLPGPSLAELARTAVASACAATVCFRGGPSAEAGTMPVLADAAGQPVLWPAAGSAPTRLPAAGPVPVTVTVPARPPFRLLELAGHAEPIRAPGTARYPVTVRSVEFTGALRAAVPLAAYRAAAPDPLCRDAPAALHHLKHGHMAELVGCVRAHGMPQAEWVVPRGLDRFGLELLVFTADGIAAVRLSFPDGAVSSLRDVPASIRARAHLSLPGAPRRPRQARRPVAHRQGWRILASAMTSTGFGLGSQTGWSPPRGDSTVR